MEEEKNVGRTVSTQQYGKNESITNQLLIPILDLWDCDF